MGTMAAVIWLAASLIRKVGFGKGASRLPSISSSRLAA